MIAVNQEDSTTDYILCLVHFDVCFALTMLEHQVKEQRSKVLSVRSDRKLFDVDELIKYLSEVFIQNTFVLEDIIAKSLRVIDLNNVEFLEIEKSALERAEKFEFLTNSGKVPVPLVKTEILGTKEFTNYKQAQGEIDIAESLTDRNIQTIRTQQVADV